jgi:hypothetical protein
MPGFHRGRPPRNKGLQYPADPPTVEEIVAVMRRAGDQPYGLSPRAVIVLLWRTGLRISEALSLAESDLDPTVTPQAPAACEARHDGCALSCTSTCRGSLSVRTPWRWSEIARIGCAAPAFTSSAMAGSSHHLIGPAVPSARPSWPV